MIFVGDRLDPEGNDYPVKALGVPCQAVDGWQDTVTYVTSLASLIASQTHDGEDPSAQVSLGARLRGEPCSGQLQSLTPIPAPPSEQETCGAVC